MSDRVYRASVPVSRDLLAAFALQPWQAFAVRLASLMGLGKWLADHFQQRALVAHVRRVFVETFRRKWEEAERKMEDESMRGTGIKDAPGIFGASDDQEGEAGP